MTGGRHWRVVLTPRAERDFAEILRWTAATFGAAQALAYQDLILEAVTALKDGPAPTGARRRDDIVAGTWTLRIGRGRNRGRHFLVYRQGAAQTIEIARILHDSMDVVRHLPPAVEP